MIILIKAIHVVLIKYAANLKWNNSFHLTSIAERLVRVNSVKEIQALVLSQDFNSKNLFILGEGTNCLLLPKIDGLVLQLNMGGIRLLNETDKFVSISVGAAENWDYLVSYATNNGWFGLENLSLIPGSVGAAPVQNIGAYGVEVENCIESVEGYDLNQKRYRILAGEQCHFDYRDSVFKSALCNRFIITSVTFKLQKQFVPNFSYPGVEESVMGQLGNQPVTAHAVRQAIITIRRSKLPDPRYEPNAGSFFKNPVVTQAKFDLLQRQYPGLPNYPQADGVKIPAAWLIDQCALKGYQMGPCKVHSRQPLVLVNNKEGDGNDILQLANLVKEKVNEMFAIELQMEVNIVGEVQ